jgi:phosphoglycerate kinase
LKEYFTIDDFNLTGKTLLCRLDLNSPMSPEGGILDDKRFKAHLPTLRELSDSKLVLMSHQSRAGKKDFTTMEAHARLLSKLLRQEVRYVDDIFGSHALREIKNMKPGDIVLLENVRFYSEESLKRSAAEHATTHMVKKLSTVADFYMNDAFAVSHRPHLSIVGFTETLPSIAGRLMEKEIDSLSRGFQGERPCIFVLGGAKVDDSLKVIKNVLEKNSADKILTTGVVANVMLAAKGYDIGKPNLAFIEAQGYLDQIPVAKQLLERFKDKIVTPVDVALNKDETRIEQSLDSYDGSLPINDIGIETIVQYAEEIKQAGTVILNGPAGVFEKDAFALGTSEIIKASTRAKFSVVGGGHIAAALENLGLEHKISHVSTGGGACIDFLAGETLPGIEALREAARKYRRTIDTDFLLS